MRIASRLITIVLGLAAIAAATRPLHAQERITGTVVEQGNVPVPVVQVIVTGTTVGALTAANGTFALTLPPGARTLTVRRIGYIQTTVPIVAGQSTYAVTLARDILKLEEQVVTGIATSISSRNSANAITVLDSTQLTRVPAQTIESALQGKIPGALVEQNNGGAPGGGMQIQIRGVTSLFSDAEPLYVVDGVIVNNETVESGQNSLAQGVSGLGQSAQDNSPNRIADLNPNDIESIQILKGSSATAIYGSKAASGVIIITTKKGAPGQPKWDFTQRLGTAFQGATLPLRQFPTLASAEAWGNEIGYSQGFIDSTYSGNHDVQSQLFGGGELGYETDLSLSGASEGQHKTNYYMSGMTKYDPGIMINTGYNKQTGRINVTHEFSPAVTITGNLSYAESLTRRGFTGNDNIGGSPYAVFGYTPSFFNQNARNSAGGWVQNPYGPANVFQDANDIQTPEQVGRFIGGGNITVKPIQTDKQTLTLTGIVGADETSQRDNIYAAPDLWVEAAQSTPGVSNQQIANTEYTNYSLNAIHHYTPAPQLDFTTSIGMSREKRNFYNPGGAGIGLLAGQNSPTVGLAQQVFYTRTKETDMSFYAQEQFLTLDQRLTLTGGVTGSKSSNDGDVNKYFLYPKASASFRVPTAGVPGLDELKLRVAYGKSGTLPNYGVRTTGLITGNIGGLNGEVPPELIGDPNVTPETNTEVETGIDATLFQSRLEFSATIYQKRISDLVLLAGITPSSGADQQWVNGGQFTNQGIELSLGATPIQSTHGGLTWDSHTTFYRNYSRVDALPVPPFDPSLGSGYGDYGGPYGQFWEQVGRSVTEWIGPVLERNGTIQTEQIGDVQPAFQMSFSNDFTFHGFHLSTTLDWKNGGTVSNNTNSYYDNNLLLADTAASERRLNYQALGVACIRQPSNNLSCAYMEDASYLKLREVTLAYDMPQWVVDKIGFGRLTNARISLSGRNLLWWYRYSGLDPEVSFTGSQQVGRGSDLTPYPPARYVYVSVDLGF